MSDNIVGIAIPAPDAQSVIDSVVEAESVGVKAAWLTSGGDAGDALTALAIAAAQTESIKLGTSIMQTWSRHPITAARQAQTIDAVAPGRLRLGVGPGHLQAMQETFGAGFEAPLGHLTEYVRVLKGLLEDGEVDFQGEQIVAKVSLPAPTGVTVMASALRPRSFEMCGAEGIGAISWVCPHPYVRDTALPAMRAAAEGAERDAPPLVVHAAVCVTDDVAAARQGVREQLGYFPYIPFYARMFAASGFPGSEESGWTDDMVDSVLLAGDEETVALKIREMLEWGADEVLGSIVTVGDAEESRMRTMRLLAEVGN